MTKRQSPKEIEREAARNELLSILKPGDTVSCILRSVSRSGMSREISFFVEGMRGIDHLVSRALDYKRGDRGLKVSGCGMDMGFHVVYSLGSVLFPDGFDCAGDHCPSNDHSNREDNKHHQDGGYAFRSRWI